MSKKWEIAIRRDPDILTHLMLTRGIEPGAAYPTAPKISSLKKVVSRIRRAIQDKESIVVYADYDADGISAGAILWETLWKLGARVMPYIPHRVDEGYGLSEKGIDAVREQFDPSLIITVDHGITAWDKVEYAKKLGIEVIVTDHHVAPKKVPDCLIVHTTETSGSGVAWIVAHELSDTAPLELAALGTIADLLPLTGLNRSIVKNGLDAVRTTKRVGLLALFKEAGLEKDAINTYAVSHIIAPRLNAMGRLDHALDALRLLCTTDPIKAKALAEKLGLTNRERQKLTEDTVVHARSKVPTEVKNIIFIAEKSYNPGIIGLVAGRLVEEWYRPTIVLSIGDGFAKASARSIPGFNIVEAIRTCSDILVDVGGHPMAAGFTVETKYISMLQEKLEQLTEKELDEEILTRVLKIDAEIPLELVTEKFWSEVQQLQPFGFGNPEPIFVSRQVSIHDVRIIGATKKHLKLKVGALSAVAFNMAEYYGLLQDNPVIDIAYSVDMNEWNGKKSVQIKVKDIQFPKQ